MCSTAERWTDGHLPHPHIYLQVEWKKIVNMVEKGEKKLEDIARLTKATQELVRTCTVFVLMHGHRRAQTHP